jgi:hypothetical protein
VIFWFKIEVEFCVEKHFANIKATFVTGSDSAPPEPSEAEARLNVI